jgi:alanine dehydrogenase
MTLILTDADVAKLLPMADCIEAMETAFRDYASRGAINLPRIRYLSDTSDPEMVFASNIHIGTTPTYDTAAIRLGGAARGRKPGDRGAQVPKHANRNWGFIVLIDMQTGEPLAFVQEFLLSGIRVGATSGAAAKHLAPPDAQTVCMFGSGKLARTNLEALTLIRPIRKVKVFSPTKEHREQFAREMQQQLEIEVTPVDDPREAMRDTEIVCCATNAGYVSGKPVFDGEWLEPGQFVISLQNSDANFKKSEVDDTTIVRSSLICINDVESVHSNGQRELLDPIEEGLISWDKICTLGEVIAGTTALQAKPDDVVYYKNSTGMGIQMSAACAMIHRHAVEQGIGYEVPTELFGSDLSDWYQRGFYPSA